MSLDENYIIENEITDVNKKQEYWNTGIGLNKVDNLEPSEYLIELSTNSISICHVITNYYKLSTFTFYNFVE